MTLRPNTYDPDAIFHQLEDAAEERANAEQEYHQLERMGEILLADLQVQAKNRGNPVGLCKEIARTAPEWRTHIEGEAVARGRLSRARARYENLKILAEARRSQEASMRVLTGRTV